VRRRGEHARTLTVAPQDPTPPTPIAGDGTDALQPLGARERARAAGPFPELAAGRHLAIEDGDGVLLVALDRPVLHLGRSTSADIVIDDATVSRRHAVIAQEGGVTVLLDDRSRNGVLVNGEHVSRAELRHGDLVQLGRVAMRYLEVE
jgi:FHA domain